jgi:hypothetical protein
MCLLYRALQKGDIMQEDDFVADDIGFYQAGKGANTGEKWNKTAYYPRYRKISEQGETEKPVANTGRQFVAQMPPTCPECPVRIPEMCFMPESEACLARLWRHFCRT